MKTFGDFDTVLWFQIVNNRLLCPDLIGFGGHILATSLKICLVHGEPSNQSISAT